MRISHTTKIIIRNIFFGAVGLSALIGGALLIWVSSIQLPDFSSFDSRKIVDSTKLYDRTGEVVLYDLNSDIKRTSIPYSDMGTTIKNATVAIEDSRFYQHHGIRIKAMVRALLADITHVGAVQGGSTITQQVIKKSLLSDDKTIVRKLKEIVLALKLEREYSKDEILGVYLNEIPYGGNVYGIAEASRSFLGKEPKDLTLAEAAYLASIPNAPTHYSPYGTHKDDLDARKNLVLAREHDLGFITDAEYAQAKAEVVTFNTQETKGIKAPHFDFFIKDYLEEKYGADTVESGGLKVITTLDYTLQQAAEKAVQTYTLGEKKQIDDENAGLVSIDPKTGQILVMVGSRDYFDKKIDGNFNVTMAKRQPGSSFKPYVYATALKDGYTPETVLFDVPTEFNTRCNPYGKPYPGVPESECYNPQNYDNLYKGPITMRNALGQSRNVPAVKMLYMVGVKNAIKTAQDMGITTLLDPDRYGLALVLGGGEVRLVEMTSAYGGFATGGIRHPYTGILSVEDKNGQVLESYEDNPVEVLPKNVALQISDILSDNVARTPTFGANSSLYFPDRQVAVKTGTTNNYKDSWTVGYTPSLVTGVWLGKNNNTTMPTSISAAPIWHMFMNEALKNYPDETFEKPYPDPDYTKLPAILRGYFQGSESFVIDTVSGKLATDKTPKETQKELVITNVHDLLYWVVKDNPRSGKPAHPESDGLYYNFETAVQNWWAQNSYRYATVTSGQKPTGYDDVHTGATAPSISIISPTNGSQFTKNDIITVRVSSIGPYPLQKMDVFLNNMYVGTAQGQSPTFSFSLNQISSALPGDNTLMVVATDSIYGGSSTATHIQLVP
jgi:1A family penicillin-binding protein